MSSGIGLTAVAVIGLVVAAVVRARGISRLRPVLETAAGKHQALIQQSFLGMPQLIKTVRGRAMRMTPMTISTASPEGGGEMTCVDFDWPTLAVGEFRMREKPDARRNAVPPALMGGSKPFTVGSARIDERYSLAGTNPEAALRILADAVVLEAVLGLPHGAEIHVRGDKCSVTVKGFARHVEFIDRLFATSEGLLAAAGKAFPG
jgi:hypothetical protein